MPTVQVNVTHDTPTDLLVNVNRALTVTVLTVGFHVYCRILRAGSTFIDVKALDGIGNTFDVIKNDTVEAHACGTGVATVTTV